MNNTNEQESSCSNHSSDNEIIDDLEMELNGPPLIQATKINNNNNNSNAKVVRKNKKKLKNKHNDDDTDTESFDGRKNDNNTKNISNNDNDHDIGNNSNNDIIIDEEKLVSIFKENLDNGHNVMIQNVGHFDCPLPRNNILKYLTLSPAWLNGRFEQKYKNVCISK